MNTTIQILFTKSLESLRPREILRQVITKGGLQAGGQTFEFGKEMPVYLIATGKAAPEMTETVQQILGNRLVRGFVVAPEAASGKIPDHIDIRKASHPVPDEHSIRAGKALTEFIRQIPEDSCVIYGLSGGTSSLLCLPADEISVGELQQTYRLLNNSGAAIREMNAARKHISRIKGGQLLRYFSSGITLFDLIISDVPGDDPATVGSGPTTPDSSTYTDAQHVFLKYGLWGQLPASVQNHITGGMHGEAPETIKPGKDPVARHHTFIIGSARKLALKVQALASDKGYQVWTADEAYNRDVEEVARTIAEKAIAVAGGNGPVQIPAALIWYGESTVNVSGNGKGGRNQELALRGALKIEGFENITWLSAGTDGIDGPTDAAGAVVDGATIPKARQAGLDPKAFLANNDAYHFHEQAGTLLKTGPTGNNLMDLQIVLIE